MDNSAAGISSWSGCLPTGMPYLSIEKAVEERQTPMWPGITAPPPPAFACPRLRAPIVLAHGLFGFRRIGLGPVTLAWYFRGIPGLLREAGNRVLVTRVHPTAGVARRAEKLGRDILGAFPDEPVHLIGHSMGGLDARALLADPAWRGRILSLTTIATPHLGSSIADFAKLRVGRVYNLLETPGDRPRRVPRRDPRRRRRVQPPDADSRRAPPLQRRGRPPPEDVCWPLRRLHAALGELEGPNDGLVSVRSANAFGTPLPTWPVDHLRQMNWLSPEQPDYPCPRVARALCRSGREPRRPGLRAPRVFRSRVGLIDPPERKRPGVPARLPLGSARGSRPASRSPGADSMSTQSLPRSHVAEILTRVIGPESGNLSPEAARSLLALSLDDQDRRRAQELGGKARDGSLTAEERDELDAYLRVARLIELLWAKARNSLGHVAEDRPGLGDD